jgi:branched-chain amino acid transport system substrate-binding protein
MSLAPGPATISPTDPKRKWIFNAPPNDLIYNGAVVDHMAKSTVKKVAIISVDDAYGEANIKAFQALVEPKGIKVATLEKYRRTDTSVTAQVLRAMQTNPDAVYIISSGTPAALPHRALVERNYKGKIYQTGGVANVEFLKIGGKEINGSYFPTSPVIVAEQLPNGYPTKKEALSFLKAYEGKFGPRAGFACLTWDAIKIVEHAVPIALKAGKPGTEQFRVALRQAIENTKGFAGANAVYSLSPTDHGGVNQFGMSIIKIENNKWKLESHADFK